MFIILVRTRTEVLSLIILVRILFFLEIETFYRTCFLTSTKVLLSMYNYLAFYNNFYQYLSERRHAYLIVVYETVA